MDLSNWRSNHCRLWINCTLVPGRMWVEKTFSMSMHRMTDISTKSQRRVAGSLTVNDISRQLDSWTNDQAVNMSTRTYDKAWECWWTGKSAYSMSKLPPGSKPHPCYTGSATLLTRNFFQSALQYFIAASSGYSLAYFMPIILRQGMGFSYALAQILSSPPYVRRP